MSATADIVFLLDVDNTLLDNDHVLEDLRDHLTQEFGAANADRYPAHHYFMVDDKLRILDAMKKIMQGRLTTIFPRQGHYALDPHELAAYSAADVTVKRIGDLLDYEFPASFGPALAVAG